MFNRLNLNYHYMPPLSLQEHAFKACKKIANDLCEMQALTNDIVVNVNDLKVLTEKITSYEVEDNTERYFPKNVAIFRKEFMRLKDDTDALILSITLENSENTVSDNVRVSNHTNENKINMLPVEMILQIISHLSFKQCQMLKMTCKQFEGIINVMPITIYPLDSSNTLFFNSAQFKNKYPTSADVLTEDICKVTSAIRSEPKNKFLLFFRKNKYEDLSEKLIHHLASKHSF